MGLFPQGSLTTLGMRRYRAGDREGQWLVGAVRSGGNVCLEGVVGHLAGVVHTWQAPCKARGGIRGECCTPSQRFAHPGGCVELGGRVTAGRGFHTPARGMHSQGATAHLAGAAAHVARVIAQLEQDWHSWQSWKVVAKLEGGWHTWQELLHSGWRLLHGWSGTCTPGRDIAKAGHGSHLARAVAHPAKALHT